MKRPLLVAAIAFLLYLPTVWYGFINLDDPMNTYRNPFFRPLTVSNVARVWTTPYKHLYIPVTYTAWAAIAAAAYRGEKADPLGSGTVLALEPAWFHLANVIVFAVSAILVYLILERLLGSGWGAFAGALLFAVHPLQVESVAWVTSLKGTLAGCLCLGALFAWLRGSARLGLLLFLLSLLAKTSTVILPLWMLVIGLLVLGRRPRELARELWPWFALGAVFVVLGDLIYPAPSLIEHALLPRVAVSLDTLAFYLGKLFFPLTLSYDYGRVPESVLASPWTLVTAAVPVGAGWLLYRHYRATREPWLVAAALLFAVTLLPVLGMKPHDLQIFSDASDRYVFLALLGPALAVGWLARSRRRLEVAAAVGVILVVKTVVQCTVWKDDFALYAHLLRVNPNSSIGHQNLAAAFEAGNDRARAAVHYERSLELRPIPEGFNHLGLVYLSDGRPGEAVRAFGRALAMQPEVPEFRENLALALGRVTPRPE